MEIYILMITISLFMTGISDYIQVKRGGEFLKKLFILFAAIPPFLVGSFRYQIGIDYSVYSRLQIPYVLNGWDKDYSLVEPGFQKIITVGYSLGEIISKNSLFPYQFIFSLINLLIIFFIYSAIYKNNNYYTLGNMIFFFSMYFFSSLNIMRQSVGCALFLYSIHYLFDKRPLKFYLINLLGVSMHKVSVVYFLTPLLKKVKNVSKVMLVLPIVITPFSYVLRELLYRVTISLNSDYSQYFNSKMDIKQNGYSLLFVTYSYLVVLFIGISYGNLKEKDKEKGSFYFLIQLISVCVAISSTFLPNAYRLLSIFLYVPILSGPWIVSMQEKRNIRLFLMISIIGIYSVFILYNFFVVKSDEFFPYKTIFNF
ncbi:hypothetical protein IGI39_002655 [Enterococcus sp. AZ135]|uniref:EpsG family protein n=1 Tax=unclassified Enterococcus TaxID=2608891 RepID=UPI003F1FABB1